MRRYYRVGMILVVVVVIVVIEAILMTRQPEPDTPIDPYTLWESHNISHYRMTYVVYPLPLPPIAHDLVIRDGEIVEDTVTPCERLSDEFTETFCEIVNISSYPGIGLRTIEDLFDTAERCIAQTRVALASCPSVPDDFVRFEVRDDMYQVGNECQTYIDPFDPWLCTVYFDDTYGYPMDIFSNAPGVDDGASIAHVRNFEPMD